MARTIIHVNQQVIARNRRHGTSDPAIIVRTGRNVEYGHEAIVAGPGRFVYQPHDPLPCGARLWYETTSPVQVVKHDGPEVC